jgi:hypothetical protein
MIHADAANMNCTAGKHNAFRERSSTHRMPHAANSVIVMNPDESWFIRIQRTQRLPAHCCRIGNESTPKKQHSEAITGTSIA